MPILKAAEFHEHRRTVSQMYRGQTHTQTFVTYPNLGETYCKVLNDEFPECEAETDWKYISFKLTPSQWASARCCYRYESDHWRFRQSKRSPRQIYALKIFHKMRPVYVKCKLSAISRFIWRDESKIFKHARYLRMYENILREDIVSFVTRNWEADSEDSLILSPSWSQVVKDQLGFDGTPERVRIV